MNLEDFEQKLIKNENGSRLALLSSVVTIKKNDMWLIVFMLKVIEITQLRLIKRELLMFKI